MFKGALYLHMGQHEIVKKHPVRRFTRVTIYEIEQIEADFVELGTEKFVQLIGKQIHQVEGGATIYEIEQIEPEFVELGSEKLVQLIGKQIHQVEGGATIYEIEQIEPEFVELGSEKFVQLIGKQIHQVKGDVHSNVSTNALSVSRKYVCVGVCINYPSISTSR
ncbi:unnamed protein product [Parnassius apollo]|uniref:(apollo) hypothetical protein n=1 Tax=Parnassius apollo TaxID=110799 RepID=A0A8S3X336_PARAO|nr:unnamed protein product [Parnassius apollo]